MQKHEDNLTKLYMALFKSSFVILCPTHGSLTVFSIQGPLHLNKLM